MAPVTYCQLLLNLRRYWNHWGTNMHIWGPSPRDPVLGLGQAQKSAAWPLPQVILLHEIWAGTLTREGVVQIP